VRGVDKHAPFHAVTTLESQLDAFLTERRFQTILLIGFAALAALIAPTGIYGLVAYTIAMRTRDIGIRMAAGASAGTIFGMFVPEGLKLSRGGLAVGVIGTLCIGRAALL
jgi:ABC-type antimicrobial peptide transport system permease subunit